MRPPRIERWLARATFLAAIVSWIYVLAPDRVPRANAVVAASAGAATVAHSARRGTNGVRIAYAEHGAAIEHWTRTPESDVVAEPYGLTIDALRALEPGARVSWPDPDGGAIELAVVARERVGDLERIRLSHDGLPSTVTLGAAHFYATIATASGAYSVSNDAGETLLVRHQALDRRINRDAPDYAAAPHA